MVARSSSIEEDDQLMRSSKKIKNAEGAIGGGILQDDWPVLGAAIASGPSNKPSFAEKLKGVCMDDDLSDDDIEDVGGEDSENVASQNSGFKGLTNEEPDFKTVEDPMRNFPTFIFSNRVKKRLYKAWKRAVIVKLLGRSIGFKALEALVQSFWAKKGVIKLINIGHGYYVVKLTNKEDYFNALTGGPWMIYDHYLTVRPWEPRFKPESAAIDKVAVWVRVPRVFLEYYDMDALTYIGDRIGKTIKVDMNTSCHLRGHYA
ncbi:uncharacterized protein LOC129316441 [Prosopis cineraria]|uniref:uncharacterized protein LOC129316441 n=1 Tax=Prosopis cineraria TaxID=364024 RepID=UPI0024104C7C|nr:uncharacterized protein LOC129316441 [Prosopis cineraria]